MNMLKRRPVQVGAFLCTTQNHSFNPQSLRDSPGGAWGPYSPNPLRRFAPMSLVPGVSGISLYAGMLFVHILYLVFDCITCPWWGFFGGIVEKFMFLMILICFFADYIV